jgi:thiol-disulfide isomerase/thioredoxin
MDDARCALWMGVTGGLIALAAALAAACLLGLVLRLRTGRFRAGPGMRAGQPSPAETADASRPDVLSEADLGGPLGQQATLVQFSTAFCAPCRPTRQILGQVADMVDGVTHVEVDAAARLDLVRRLRINSTPTVLVLDPDGAIVKRASGLPRKADVIAALGSVIEPTGPGVTAPAGGE